MTEKRFKLHIEWSNITKTEGIAELSDNGQPLLETECIEDARLLQTILNELHDENKKLKAQLHCTHDGVCDICNNEYLVQQGKYYVSKCKKGHEECSKMDLSYCEDFELKGDGVE